MVQNRNWESRVEEAIALRKEAHQRRQKCQEKRIFKSMMNEVLALLDRHSDSIRRRSNSDASDYSSSNGQHKKKLRDTDTTNNNKKSPTSSLWDLHVWTDNIPMESLSLLEMATEDINVGKPSRRARSASLSDVPPNAGGISVGNGRKGRARAGSFQQEAGISAVPLSTPKGRKGRARSGSFQQEGSKCTKKGRPRSNSKGEWSGSLGDTPQPPRAMHPRSNSDASESDMSNSAASAPQLCKSHFFFGKCSDSQKGGGGKKGKCRCFHYNNKQFKTLGAILSRHQGNHKTKGLLDPKKTLSEAKSMYCRQSSLDSIDSDSGSMDMLYHIRIPIPNDIGSATSTCSSNKNSTEEDDNDVFRSTISDLVSGKLNSNACSIASIVYMVISTPSKDVLLYDRNRENGLVISDFVSDILGVEGDDSTENDGAILNPAKDLPISVLEHILDFVDATTVAAAAQVCKAWNREIGHASPNLWRHMLEKRSWPLPLHIGKNAGIFDPHDTNASLHEKETSDIVAQHLRDEFVKHYSVNRDIRAIQMALTGLLTKRSPEEREMTFQSFAARRGSPQAPNRCVGVEVWGPNRVLAAYSNDCTLRLFQAVSKGKCGKNDAYDGLSEKYCREVVCTSIDPFKSTKKKSCFIESMGLDDDVVGCLCTVTDETSNSNDNLHKHILVILSRDDLLLSDSSSTEASGRIREPEEGALSVIDIEEAVLNYILCLDYVDARLLRLHDFLSMGGHIEDTEILVSRSMASCGYGRFMIEVAISIPMLDDEHDDDEDSLSHMGGMMLLLDRKLFLISSSLGAIVWMGDSNAPTENLRPRQEDMTLVSLRGPRPAQGTRTACNVTTVPHYYASTIMSCDIDPSGSIEGNFVLGSSEWSREERITEADWTESLDGPRPVVMTPTDIVVGDTLTRQRDGENGAREFKTIITFYSRSPSEKDSAAANSSCKLLIGENCAIDHMVRYGDDYVILLCRYFPANNNNEIEDVDADETLHHHRLSQVHAITIHVPNRQAIERLCLYEDYGSNKLSFSVVGNTVACGVWLKGLIMTGSDVRAVGTSDATGTILEQDVSPSKVSRKKGNKARRSKGKKVKDGFQRGMTLRG